MDHFRFNLNGAWVKERGLSPTTTLLRYLRDSRALTGTKEGCAEGDCGACTVAVAELSEEGRPTWKAINSCLLFLPMVQGKHVVTVDALKDAHGYHPAQLAMAKAMGSQCGYCTPGIVMSLFEATYRADIQQSAWKLDDQLCGNLCRCTGYRPIREAAVVVAGTCPKDRFAQVLEQARPESMALHYQTDKQRFVTPTSFDDFWSELDAHPEARFVAGGTDLSLEVTKRFALIPKLISLEGLTQLQSLAEHVGGYRLGSGATIAQLEDFCELRLPSLHRMVRYFGARQIKHRGTLGGNLCTASPIGDLAPVLISLGATAIIMGKAGERRVVLEQFFKGYRKTALGPGEILAAVEVPSVPSTVRAVAYKVSKRRELDISTVSAAFYVDVDDANKVSVARLTYGGLAATTQRASRVEVALLGKLWTEEVVTQAAQEIAADFRPLSDHRGSSAYRLLVAKNLLKGFFQETLHRKNPVLTLGHTATVQFADGGAQ